MDFKQLRYVLKIAEVQSITKAAKELYISQPSLSHFVKKIEDELGVPIFNRSTTPISLTLAGEKYVRTAKSILKQYQHLKDEVLDISTVNKGRLKIGIPHSRAAYMLPQILPDFTKKYPNIEIKTFEAETLTIKDYLMRGLVDFAILPFYTISKDLDDSLDYEFICKEELFLIAGEKLIDSNYVDGQDTVSFDKLKNYQFILLTKGHGIRYAIDKLFDEHSFRPQVFLETTSNETAYRMATAGLGVAIVPEISLYLFKSIEKPYIYKLSDSGIQWDIVMIYRKSDNFNHLKRLFLDMTKNKFKELKDRKNFFD